MGQNRALSLEAPIFAVASSFLEMERGTSSFLERDKEYLQTVLRFESRLHDGSMAVEFT